MSNFVINKNALNTVIVTASERSELTNPYYLIVFTNKFNTSGNQNTSVSVMDSATPNIRYNMFEITETSNPNGLNAEVELDAGEWSYNIYESLNQTLNAANTTGRVLQTGFIIVEDGNI
jgi:hypothetical protein